MMKFLTEKFAHILTGTITDSIESLLQKYQRQTDSKLNHILTHVESLRIELKDIESRLQTKEIRDKADYGHVQYKINSIQSELISKKRAKLKNSSN